MRSTGPDLFIGLRASTAAGVIAAALVAAPGHARPAAGGGGAALSGCLERLERARRAWTELEPDFVERLYPPKLFQAGAPNAAAQRALLPVLERTLERAAAGIPGLSLSLECRTWACRMLVLQPSGSATAGWENALTSAPELRERIRASSVAARRRTADTLGGHDLVEATVFLKLADPSGQPRPIGSRPQARSRPGETIPDTPALCAAELEKADKVVAAMRRVMARTLTPPERFASEPANDPLTKEMTVRLRQAVARLPPAFGALTVECRGVVCRVAVPPPVALDRRAWKRLEARPELRSRIVGRAYQGDAYWLVRPAETVDGRAVLDELLPAIEARPFFDHCHARHPASGHLLVRYLLPGNTVFGARGPRDQIEMQYSGSLADSPLGRCIADQLARAVAEIPLPDNRLQAYRERRYDWPRKAAVER